MTKTVLVTGGAGFIGSALVRHLMAETSHRIVNVDKLTYAADLTSLRSISGDQDRYVFERYDICDAAAMEDVFSRHNPDVVMHLAAESHVDRSIDGPAEFIKTNVEGTFVLLETALQYWRAAHAAKPDVFRFLHVSTDEVFGSLGPTGYFSETSQYQPNSPYSASKASSDHLVRAWHETYGLPTLITNCTNNYGPYQFPEKLIPVVILKILAGQEIPVYGTGENIRDWLFVGDHVRALWSAVEKGAPGETYCIGGDSERTNIDLVRLICAMMDELQPLPDGKPAESLITFVEDRPGHDKRYAMDCSRAKAALGWVPQETFETGIRKTVEWYLNNREWWEEILEKRYAGQRLGRGREQAAG